MREQEEGEPIDVFITDLYTLAEHCSYGELHDEMIRDRIVVGIRSAKLSEKLQLDPKLTLETAVTQARQAEAVKLQQAVMRGEGAEYDTLPVGTLSEVRPHRPRRPTTLDLQHSVVGVAHRQVTIDNTALQKMQNATNVVSVVTT